MNPEQTLDWLAQQHWEQCREERPIQDWIRKMKSQLPAQTEHEPAAWMYPDALCDKSCLYVCTKAFTQFPECATTPPQRTWAGLTDEEANELWESTDSDWELMKRTEAKLKEKNK